MCNLCSSNSFFLSASLSHADTDQSAKPSDFDSDQSAETFLTEACTCKVGGVFYAPELSDGCTSYTAYSDPLNSSSSINGQCPDGSIFDLDSCSCYDEDFANCPRKCPKSGERFQLTSTSDPVSQTTTAVDPSCFCTAGGNAYYANSADGCTSFIQSVLPAGPDAGTTQQCGAGTIWDVNACTCNFISAVTCPTNCPFNGKKL